MGEIDTTLKYVFERSLHKSKLIFLNVSSPVWTSHTYGVGADSVVGRLETGLGSSVSVSHLSSGL